MINIIRLYPHVYAFYRHPGYQKSLSDMTPVYDYEADEGQDCFPVKSLVLDNVRSE